MKKRQVCLLAAKVKRVLRPDTLISHSRFIGRETRKSLLSYIGRVPFLPLRRKAMVEVYRCVDVQQEDYLCTVTEATVYRFETSFRMLGARNEN